MQPTGVKLFILFYTLKSSLCVMRPSMTAFFVYFADMGPVSPSVENISWPKHLEDFTTTLRVGTIPQLQSFRSFHCYLTLVCVFWPEEWNADVDSYVVHTNYDEYALVVMYKQKTGGEKSTSVKLYGKTTLFFLENI